MPESSVIIYDQYQADTVIERQCQLFYSVHRLFQKYFKIHLI
jgi:hypothetical protein